MSEKQFKVQSSLSRTLISWFLLLALLPLGFTAWIAYQQTVGRITQATVSELEVDSKYGAKLIQDWFDDRFSDIDVKASNHRSSELLIDLHSDFLASGKVLSQYVKSDAWASLVDSKREGLSDFVRHYDYVDDLFLIDVTGNILFSVSQRSDLGTNLLDAAYLDTKFSQTVKFSIDNGEHKFSDIQRYKPFNDRLVGFFTAPMLNEEGDKIGVLAIQVNIDRIDRSMLENVGENSLSHYLVGEDDLLRTPVRQEGLNEVLSRRVDTEQMKLWHIEHARYESPHGEHPERVFEYIGPNGDHVFGIHQTIRAPGVSWAFISEIRRDDSLAPIANLKKTVLIIFLITVALVVVIASYQTRRITRPIIKLAEISKAVAAGDIGQKVTIKSNNEIGILIDSFNEMLAARQQHTKILEESNEIAQIALFELEKQKFALDQHAIVAITDVKGNIIFVNDKFTEISGYCREELLGKNHRLLNSGHHEIEFFKNLYQVIVTGNVWHGEICNRAKDGHIYWVDTTIVPFMGTDGKPKSYTSIRTDISNIKQAEVELIRAKESAEIATQQKSDFLANMSHEIRTPMNGIIGMTGLMLDTRLTQKQRSYVEATMSSADALLTIINDILDFSKIEAGKLELEEVPFNLQLLTEEIAELMAIKCREKNIEMLLHYKPGTEQRVVGDPGRVRQILLNLLSNAIKFTEYGHVLLVVESIRSVDGYILFNVSVIDTGGGIAKDKLGNIFNKFDQEDSSTTRKFGGTGLGLSICRQLTHLMGGEVGVESEKGKGSVFNFTMKLLVDKSINCDQVGSDVYAGINNKKILLVDDNDVARQIIAEQLSEMKARVSEASSAKLALKNLDKAALDQDEFDIIIIDHLMPEMNGDDLGYELLINKMHERSAKVLLTSQPSKGDVLRLKELGFDGYLTKPTHPSELGKIMTMVLNAKKESASTALITRHTLLDSTGERREKPRFENAQVLLVEDNPVNVAVATALLEGYGCTVTPAGNGVEAVALVVEERRLFDLVFMDCQMPEMDGFEATKLICEYQLNKKLEHIPIVAFTANAMKSDEEKCLEAGMDDFISKPVNRKALETVLLNWLPDKLVMGVYRDDEPQDTLLESGTAVLDLETFNGLKKLFADRFEALIEQHTQSARENVALVAVAIEKSDIESLERAAHSLKGASAQFGAVGLMAVALEVEELAKQGCLDDVAELLTELMDIQKQTAEVMLEQLN